MIRGGTALAISSGLGVVEPPTNTGTVSPAAQILILVMRDKTHPGDIDMRVRLSALILIVALGGGTAYPRAQGLDEHAVRKELEAKYAKVVEAYKNKDIKAFMENKTPDFTARSLNGRVATRQQVENGVKQRMERIIRLNYLKIEIKQLTITGDEAVAITTQEFSRVVADGQGQERTVVSAGTTHRDRWVKTANRWMLKSVEELAQGKESVEGQGSIQ